jgi:RHH-type transcriptional regulator, proline utilization regulon repressor / proline dehydrogenase / delta 1-pyrroline-5-carboxylate dehydrogenase
MALTIDSRSGDVGDGLTGPAIELAREWLIRGQLRGAEARQAARLASLTSDPDSVSFVMAFCDRVLRPTSVRVAAGQLRRLAGRQRPAFLSRTDMSLLRTGAVVSHFAPRLVMALARRRLRAQVGDLVADATPEALGAHVARLRAGGFSVNVNLLGETVLGHAEAERRRAAIIALIDRADVDYVSVKLSSICAGLSLWGHEDSAERAADALREVFCAAHRPGGAFVNLDMEDYKDLALTLEVFMVLDEPALHEYSAGIVLQAYLPDSHGALERLARWARARVNVGGAPVKVRIVKGANLAMERVDAALHDWPLATYHTKAETDASYMALIDEALHPRNAGALRVGIAGHNLFDLAWAHLLATERVMSDSVTFEMLEGMAPGIARAVSAAGLPVLLYTPVVAPDDFDHALAYLFRRLEENAAGENFLAHLPMLHDQDTFDAEATRFEAAVSDRHGIRGRPFRTGTTETEHRVSGFVPAVDTDPSDPAARDTVLAAVRSMPHVTVRDVPDASDVDAIVGRARAAQTVWAAHSPEHRAAVLRSFADVLGSVRPQLVSLLVHEGRKAVQDAEAEVSECIDFARCYATSVLDDAWRDGLCSEPLGVVAVAGPWNFPLALSLGGAFAALASGNAAIVKPAPQTPLSASFAVDEIGRSSNAALPGGVLQCVVVDDGPVGTHLIAHDGVDAVVLTGSYETAEYFSRQAPGRPLFAETSGKNAMVIMPEADLDLAAEDMVRSAFGHAGQKCSAASLGILVGDVATSPRFSSQLLDAASSLIAGPATDPAATMTPLVEPPSDRLLRALCTLEPHQRWLLEPRLLDGGTQLWSPGIVAGVRPGDWLAQTECFGPVLALIAAEDLTEAIEIQNSNAFGLTGGLWSLDPRHHRIWLDRVDVGNAYVNRAITGAIVGRQPFGGWKGSVVGPGAKAGGPNYVAQLTRLADAGRPTKLSQPGHGAETLLEIVRSVVGEKHAEALSDAARSDAYWLAHEFGIERDEAGLFCERNVLLYRPIPVTAIRVGLDANAYALSRTLLALQALHSDAEVSVHPDADIAGIDEFLRRGGVEGISMVREPSDEFRIRMAEGGCRRIRLLGSEPELHELAPAIYVDARPACISGRVELLRYLREQSVSITTHRFGNPIGNDLATIARRA